MASGKSVKPLPVDERGVIDLVKLGQLLNQTGGRAVVAIHHANNESGVIQPIAEAARLVRAAGGWLHVDAIQSAGKIPVDMRTLKADRVSSTSMAVPLTPVLRTTPAAVTWNSVVPAT